MEMASAALDSIQTPTKRVLNVLFWSWSLAESQSAPHIRTRLLGRLFRFEGRDGTLDGELEGFIEFIHVLLVSFI